MLAALRGLGCKARIAGRRGPLEVVLIDGSLVWCGDVAPLPYPRGGACALRLVSRGVAAGLVKALEAQRDWTALHDGPLLRNRSCEGEPMTTSDPSSQACGLGLITLQLI